MASANPWHCLFWPELLGDISKSVKFIPAEGTLFCSTAKLESSIVLMHWNEQTAIHPIDELYKKTVV